MEDRLDTGNLQETSISAKESKKNRNASKIILVVSLAIIIVLAILYVLVSNYYKGHFYLNTKINGITASNKTVENVQDEVNDELINYTLTLEGRNNASEVINGYNIEINAVFGDNLEKLLESQKGYDWPKYLFEERDINIETMIEFDEDLFNLVFKSLDFFKEDYVIEPVDAYITEYNGKSFDIVPEVQGNKVKEDVLFKATAKSIQNLESNLSLEEIDVYEKPTIYENDPELVQLAKDLNDLTSAEITYEFGDVTEVVDGNRIKEWVIVDENNQVSLDTEGIKEFVDYIGSHYNTFGKTRTLKTTYGPTIEVKGGDYGWWLNRGKEVEELTVLIKEGSKLTKEPSYLQTAAHYGADDVGDTYVEVNITAQHLYFYKDGQLIVESDFVSGNISRGHTNPLGTFPVQYKERDAILTGENYASPVDYWMPFNGDIGFHDASWRNTFGGNIYKTNGSRGCINMPHDAAKRMYEHIERGVAVFVYELAGTESVGN